MNLQIIAHRGASEEAPENTLASVNLACEQNADGVEIDVRLTKDQQIVAFHDETLARVNGCGDRLDSLTLSELRQFDVGKWKSPHYQGERIPTLEEILETLPVGKPLYVEIKCGLEIQPPIVRLLNSHAKRDQVVLIGYGFDVLSVLKKELPEIPALQILRLSATPKGPQETHPDLADWIPRIEAANLDGFDLGITHLLLPETVQNLKGRNLRICTWTINEAHEAKRLAEIGVEAVTTDRPQLLREELAQLSGA